MASLNHVNTWSDHGWVRITAEEAAKKHPGGTVSAQSHIFWCELCGQYVTFTDGNENVRHFRHSANEQSKNCPERTFGPLYSPTYRANEHDLPIRLIPGNNSIRLELGLLYIPNELLADAEKKTVTIRAGETTYHYKFERLNQNAITYLPIGTTPYEKYEVISPSGLDSFWSETVHGINRSGTLFDYQSGKKLTVDADVQVHQKYFLLTTRLISLSGSSIDISLSCKTREGWRLYTVEATEMDLDAANFFLSLHHRLTDKPLTLNALWPLHVRTPYVIKHPGQDLIIHIYGRREKKLTTFPSAGVSTIRCSRDGLISRIICNGRQQLISSGLASVLQYMYYWRESIDATVSPPKIQVQDFAGNAVASGENTILPDHGMINVLLPYDGQVIVRENNKIIDKRRITSGKYFTVEPIRFGMELEILVGLDTLWVASFVKPQTESSEDAAILAMLKSFGGKTIPMPHWYGALAGKMEAYPQTRQWLSQTIRRGAVPEASLRYLKRKLLETMKE